jgi:hypothetical protein
MPEAVYHQPGVRSIWKIVNSVAPSNEESCLRCLRENKTPNHTCVPVEEYLMKIGGYRCQIGCEGIFDKREVIVEHLLKHTDKELEKWLMGREILEEWLHISEKG